MSGWIMCLRPIPGHPCIFVDRTGGVWSQPNLYRGNSRLIRRSQKANRYGYLQLHVKHNGSRKTVECHRLIVMGFIGPIPESLVVDHINGVKTDNRVSNLQLLTRSQNIKKAIDAGGECGRRPPFGHPRGPVPHRPVPHGVPIALAKPPMD